MLGYLMANGVNSNDYGIYLTDAGVYGIAEKDVEAISIAGRNGDLLYDNHRYLNKPFTYPALIVDDFERNFTAFVNYLLSQKGYIRLEDSFKPEQYLMATYTGGTDPAIIKRNGKDGIFEIQFNRKPQRFLKEGETIVEITGNTNIKNPCLTDALPIVRVYGTGSVTINGIQITVNTASGYTDIDCDTQNAYKGNVNCNNNITLNNGQFFTLKAGVNPVILNGVSRIEIKPNWWIL